MTYYTTPKTLVICGEEITELVIPNSITDIPRYAFAGCSKLTSLTIPNSVTSIGEYAFANCPIETATIPGIAASFIKNNNLKTVVLTSGENIADSAFENCSRLTSIEIPNGITSIGRFAFEGCSSLTSITIPNSVTGIGSFAFKDCSLLTIYCEAPSEPSGWDSWWNFSNCPVVWDYNS